MIAKRGLKFQKEKKNTIMGTHRQNVTGYLTSCESFLNEHLMIEAKITAWPDMVLNYSEEIFKAIILLTRQD